MQDTAGCCTCTELSVTLLNHRRLPNQGESGGWKLCPLTSPTFQPMPPRSKLCSLHRKCTAAGKPNEMAAQCVQLPSPAQTTISSNRCRPRLFPFASRQTLVSYFPAGATPASKSVYVQSTECRFSYKQQDAMVPAKNTPLVGPLPVFSL